MYRLLSNLQFSFTLRIHQARCNFARLRRWVTCFCLIRWAPHYDVINVAIVNKWFSGSWSCAVAPHHCANSRVRHPCGYFLVLAENLRFYRLTALYRSQRLFWYLAWYLVIDFIVFRTPYRKQSRIGFFLVFHVTWGEYVVALTCK